LASNSHHFHLIALKCTKYLKKPSVEAVEKILEYLELLNGAIEMI